LKNYNNNLGEKKIMVGHGCK